MSAAPLGTYLTRRQETIVEGSEPYLTLFDTGPDSRAIIRNIEALQVPVERIERVILSHWHADHSGGMLAFLRRRQERASQATVAAACVLDLHPDRPIARGIAARGSGIVVGRLPPDPTFAQIEAAGGVVEKHAEGHAVAGGTVWVSGEIPRVTHFEGGLPSGVRWVETNGQGGWTKEEVSLAALAFSAVMHLGRIDCREFGKDIMDERYAAIDVIGKGLIIFSA